MALKIYKPTSPGRRNATGSSFEEITRSKPQKNLLKPLKKSAGRNSRGKITVRRRGGGAKRRLRVIDFKRDNLGVPGKVASIEYDPNRTGRIALIHYVDGDKRYILAPWNLEVGTTISSGDASSIKVGNALPLRAIPTGTTVHNIELRPGKGAQLVRGSGTAAQVLAKDGIYTLLRLPSGELRRVESECMATIGQVGNPDEKNLKLGKAGRNRWKGKRPSVRGSAMSPRDHPHGGGEGRSPIGLPGPKTPWGKPALGFRTRRNKKSDKMIIRRRS